MSDKTEAACNAQRQNSQRTTHSLASSVPSLMTTVLPKVIRAARDSRTFWLPPNARGCHRSRDQKPFQRLTVIRPRLKPAGHAATPRPGQRRFIWVDILGRQRLGFRLELGAQHLGGKEAFLLQLRLDLHLQFLTAALTRLLADILRRLDQGVQLRDREVCQILAHILRAPSMIHPVPAL